MKSDFEKGQRQAQREYLSLIQVNMKATAKKTRLDFVLGRWESKRSSGLKSGALQYLREREKELLPLINFEKLASLC